MLTLSATVFAVLISVVINTVFGITISILLVRYEFPASGPQRLRRPAARRIPDRRRSVARARLQRRSGSFGPPLEGAGFRVMYAFPAIVVMATTFVAALPLVIREVRAGAPGGRHRPGAGGAEPRRQRFHGSPAHHPPRDQVGGHLRDGACNPRPLPRRVRCGEGRRPATSSASPAPPPSPSRRSTSTSTSPARTPRPSSSPWSFGRLHHRRRPPAPQGPGLMAARRSRAAAHTSLPAPHVIGRIAP